jgi:hypothetical protein
MAKLQRSVACGVIERQEAGPLRAVERSAREQAIAFESQDRLLACRLRSYLISQGLRDSDVVDFDSTPYSAAVDLSDTTMDVDVGVGHSPLVSVDMDIDVEPSANSSPSSSRNSSPGRSPSPSPGSTLTHPKLVAALIMRHKDRVHDRSDGCSRPSSERNSTPLGWKRLPSPLSRCEPSTETLQTDVSESASPFSPELIGECP